MSVDDYPLRHLQGSCCNWLGPSACRALLKEALSSASAVPTLRAKPTHTRAEKDTQMGIANIACRMKLSR
ncbi:hypothetical protein EYF80_027646 [Liparis tanakae]|uniref:Uncharacterized protein n=1 Tax=Liparis tanakae TaxID=230148 RepID=A0A4Z2H8Q0_9TELE|nr:hypothetical protein EYF80_027646 [Liparis tanakae]